LNLPWLAVGAAGFVSVIGHVLADRLRALISAFDGGDHGGAREIHASTLGVIGAFSQVGGVAFSKAALRLIGLDVGDPRLPQVPADPDQVTAIAAVLTEAGVLA
ncbi:MAG TPA: dihydrodipicolinate synthase family protein, partial [Pseudonocardiaceae bacterium]|nr:dihydrodipicolinate synthase family protein [Pseudonocardiaceae bacterium]